MMQATCVIPVGWSIGRAAVALCDRADALDTEQRARFNWVWLVARPGHVGVDLAVRYWAAIGQGVGVTDDILPTLALSEESERRVEVSDHVAEGARRDLARRRGVSA